MKQKYPSIRFRQSESPRQIVATMKLCYFVDGHSRIGPASPLPAGPVDCPNPSATPSPLEKLRVLVVDDEEAIADSLSIILQSKGFDVRAAYSAEEAIALTAAFKPQAVLSDVRMPGLSGIDLAIHLEKHEPECKVLLMSGYGSAFALTEKIAPFRPIRPKPIHPDEIFRFLASCREPG